MFNCHIFLGGSITECRDGLADPVDARVVADDSVEGIHHDHLKAFCLFCQIYICMYIYNDYICIPYCILMYIYIILYDIYIRREREGTNGYQILRLLVVFLCSVCVSISCHAASPRTTCERHLVPPWFISYQRGWFYRFQGVRFCLLLLEEIWWKPNSALSWGKEPFWLKIWMILGSVLQVFTISVAPSCYLSQLEVCRAAQ